VENFEVQSRRVDRIYVTYSEHLDIATYVDGYLQERNCRLNDGHRKLVRECIARYPSRAAFTKVNMDFWLDSNGMKAVCE
jgi:hypothetical protein